MMDAFGLLDAVTSDYANYVQSFLRIRNPEIARYVTDKLNEGVLWPPPLVQLAPSYQEDRTVDEAYLYSLTRDELRYILDPKDVYGPDFPGDTFRLLKEKEIRQFAEYRTQRLVLEAWDRLAGGQ